MERIQFEGWGRPLYQGALGTALMVFVISGAGCATGPRSLRDLQHQAGTFRARAVELTRAVPTPNAIPQLLAMLDDPDPIVRMSAHEELKHRTGHDLGFKPWEEADARRLAIVRWQEWWAHSQASASSPYPPNSQP